MRRTAHNFLAPFSRHRIKIIDRDDSGEGGEGFQNLHETHPALCGLGRFGDQKPKDFASVGFRGFRNGGRSPGQSALLRRRGRWLQSHHVCCVCIVVYVISNRIIRQKKVLK